MNEREMTIKKDDLSRSARKRRTATLAAKYAVAALLCLFFCFPYLYMLNKSLMTVQQAAEGSSFWTRSFELCNFGIVGQYLKNIGNTLQVVCINGFFVPFTALFCAFPIARMRFAGKKIVFAVIMATVMIPNTVLMVPTYILFVKFGFVDKLVSQWIGSFWGGGALNIFLAVQFMRSIPKEIDNAAKIDGANWFQIYFGMIFPLCFNIFLYICISTVMGLWMDFQGPLIYLNSEENFTVGLAFYYNFNSDCALAEKTNEMMAMCVFVTVVPMALFFAFQKQMIGGIQVGSLK